MAENKSDNNTNFLKEYNNKNKDKNPNNVSIASTQNQAKTSATSSNQTVISKVKKYAFIWALIAVCVALIVSAVFNIFLSVKLSEFKNENQHSLLNSLNLDVAVNESVVKSVTLLNNIVSGIEYPQQVKVGGSKLVNEQVVRAKATLTNSDGEEFAVFLEPEVGWIEGDDGYVYFNGVVSNLTESFLTKKITLPEKFSSSTKNELTHTLTFVVESLNYSNGYASLIWQGAPAVWLETFGGGQA